jgi:hypothetical protein
MHEHSVSHTDHTRHLRLLSHFGQSRVLLALGRLQEEEEGGRGVRCAVCQHGLQLRHAG